MENIVVKSGQTGLDIVNNTYASLDYILQMYTDNATFDINKMQKDTFVYTKLNNQKINTIVNNKYTFVNGDVPVFTDVIKLKIADCSFNTFLELSTYYNEQNVFLDYKYQIINDTRIISVKESTLDNYVNLYNVINDMTISIGNEYYQFNDLVISSISLGNRPIIEIAFNKINVGNGFLLSMNQLPLITDFSFLNNLNFVKGFNDVITIDATGTLKTKQKMANFLYSLAHSPIGTADFYGALLITGSQDVTPFGDDWDTLVAAGWTN